MNGPRRLKAEVWIVLGLSLGQSAIYAAVSLIAKLTSDGGLRRSTATLNSSQSTREYLDLTLQILGIGFALVPVALALYLLSLDRAGPVSQRLGIDRSQPGHDVVWGLSLAAVIGLPGLGLYFAARAIGLNADVIPSGLDQYWWTVPVLILSAVQNAVLEEVVVVGYLITRFREFSWSVPAAIVTSAAVRGGYHFYQGFGAGLGNFVMGLIFGYWFHRTKRVLPLVIAHTFLDIVAFVGYSLFADSLGLR
ncbi:MAG: CPBP family intramembrane metalloprotease [Actinomycetota bacterium]|nr:CPBP family intramembrane metalloprotease [Actinomycetota bacterium]